MDKELQKNIQTFDGIVIGNSADKTVSVSVQNFSKHPKYKKYIKKTRKILADDQTNSLEIGDRVQIQSCKPISKRKSFRAEKIN